MLEQVKQVSKTYLTQRQFWWLVVFGGLVMLPNLGMILGPGTDSDRNAHSVMFTSGMPLLFLVPILVGHAKWQFAHWRARLMPNFLPAHLMLLVAILLALFVVYPGCLAWAAGFQPLGLLAITAAIGVPTIWAAHANRFAPI